MLYNTRVCTKRNDDETTNDDERKNIEKKIQRGSPTLKEHPESNNTFQRKWVHLNQQLIQNATTKTPTKKTNKPNFQ